MKNLLNALKKAATSKVLIFAIATAAMFAISYSIDLLSTSGDAQETWLVAKTFFSDNKYYSYVMYKGIYAFLPSVIDLKLSALLHIPEQLITKLFNALCFGYVGAYGIPGLINSIYPNKKTSLAQRYLLIALLLVFECNINYILSVDMISCAMLFALCNCAIRVAKSDELKFSQFILLGILTGLNLCFSGQFLFSAVIVSGAAIIRVFVKHFKKYGFKSFKKHGALIAAMILFAVSYVISHLPNDAYFAYVVDPARESGAWIPTGGDWIINGLSQNLLLINYPYQVPDNLSMSFIPAEQLEYVKSGGLIYDYFSYIKLIITHPIHFAIRWSERLYLGVMNDPKNTIALSPKYPYLWMIAMSAIVYSLFAKLKDKFKKYHDFISIDAAIFLAFLMSALVPSFGHVENRYFFTMRCFIYGVFAISPYLNETFENLKSKLKNRTIEPISWRFFEGLIFMLLSLIIYTALYQSAGIINF